MQSAPGFRIAGRVIDENGAPVAGAMVTLMPDFPNGFMGPPGHATTGDDGRFTFTDVASATYRVNASIPVVVNNGRGGAASGGAVIAGGSFSTWSSAGAGRGGAASSLTLHNGGGGEPTQVVVNGADVSGVRVVVRRAQQ